MALDGQEAVDDTDAASSGHLDGHRGFRDGVHIGRNDRDVELDFGSDLSVGADCATTVNVGVFGDEQNIVKSECRSRAQNHGQLLEGQKCASAYPKTDPLARADKF